jgi:hypothetical protein
MIPNWQTVWQELQDNLTNQPRCNEHSDYPCVKTLSVGVINDIVVISSSEIQVRSHRTRNLDTIKASKIEKWWKQLVAKGSASLKPGHPNNPDPYRSRIIGAILVTCLSDRILLADMEESLIQLI